MINYLSNIIIPMVIFGVVILGLSTVIPSRPTFKVRVHDLPLSNAVCGLPDCLNKASRVKCLVSPGLGNVIISAPLQSVYDVQIGVIGSQQNNRNSGHVFLDLPEQLKPTAIRQIDIQQDQGYTAAKQLFLRRF